MNLPLSPIVEHSGMIFCSGQIPLYLKAGNMENDPARATDLVLRNMAALLEEAGCTMADVVKTTVFVKDLEDYEIINSEYAKHFTAPYPARSLVQVSRLPRDSVVEIECIAIRK